MKIKGIGHVGIVVPSIPEAMDFYCGVMGLKVAEEACDWVTNKVETVAMGMPECLHRIASLEAPDGTNIELVEFEEGIAGNVEGAELNSCLGKHHISYVVDDIHAWLEELAKHNVKPFLEPLAYETPDAEGGVAYWCMAEDPFGVIMELMQM